MTHAKRNRYSVQSVNQGTGLPVELLDLLVVPLEQLQEGGLGTGCPL